MTQFLISLLEKSPSWRQKHSSKETTKALLLENEPKHGLSAWWWLFRPRARQPTWNARNARLLLDRRPCSTYWLLVGRAEGAMSKMSSHTMGTRRLWLFSQAKHERFPLRMLWALVLPLTLWEKLLSAETSHTCLECQRKKVSESNQAVPF